MATFNLGSAGNVQDLKQVKSYLYKLEEQLKYMFSNLDPEENFDSRAKLIFAANAERQAALEVALEGLSASYITKDSFAQMALTKDEAALTYATQDTMSKLELTVDGIEASYVTKTGVAAAINLNQQGVKIKGTKITLEGAVSFNNKVTIDADTGLLTARDATFSGNIDGGTITIGAANSTTKFRVAANGNLSIGTESSPNFSVTNQGAVTIKSGTIKLGFVSGSNPERYRFSVDNNGNLKIGGTASTPAFEITNAGVATSWNTTSNHFVRMQSGKISAGVSNSERAEISLAGTLTDDTVTPTQTFDAIGIHSEATILAGSVWTTPVVDASSGVKRGKTYAITGDYWFCLTPKLYYDSSQDYYYFHCAAVTLSFVNGLLVDYVFDPDRWVEPD